MRVILLADVKGLGRKDDVKEVKEGFFRNVLQTKHLAVVANDIALKKLSDTIDSRNRAAEAQKKFLIAKADELSKERFMFELAVGVGENAFGSVSAHDLEIALQKRGVQQPIVELKKPIKTIGEHAVICNLGSGVQTTLNIVVKSKS